MNKLNITAEEFLRNLPVRISITDYCNLGCFFCSNEGMCYTQRNYSHIDINKFKTFINLLKQTGLKYVSITGGEPTSHPNIDEILTFLTQQSLETIFLHTNGILLNEQLIDKHIDSIKKLAVSIHATDFTRWHKITNGSSKQYELLQENLKHLKGKDNVEIKQVTVKGVNDDAATIKSLADFCAENNFQYKILNLEAQSKDQIGLVPEFTIILDKLESIGAKEQPKDRSFRGQASYLPINRYEYNGIKIVAIDIGCGRKKVCTPCYLANEIFVTPQLEFKPCHISAKTFSISGAVQTRDAPSLADKIVASRAYLKSKPGRDKAYWRQYE